MADLDDGYTRIANEILESLATVKLSPTQYRIIFVIWRFTYGFKRKQHELSLSFVAEATGIDERQIQRELKKLEEKNIIFQNVRNGVKRSIGFNKNCYEWASTYGEIAIGETVKGESTYGETVKGSFDDSTEGTFDDFTPQERKSLKKNLNIASPSVDADSENEILAKTKQVEDYFCNKRQSGAAMSVEDYKMTKQMIVDGIPVELIKSCIDQSFENYKPKHRMDKIRSISYCVPRCYDAWAKSITENVPSEPVALGHTQRKVVNYVRPGGSPQRRDNEYDRLSL